MTTPATVPPSTYLLDSILNAGTEQGNDRVPLSLGDGNHFILLRAATAAPSALFAAVYRVVGTAIELVVAEQQVYTPQVGFSTRPVFAFGIPIRSRALLPGGGLLVVVHAQDSGSLRYLEALTFRLVGGVLQVATKRILEETASTSPKSTLNSNETGLWTGTAIQAVPLAGQIMFSLGFSNSSGSLSGVSVRSIGYDSGFTGVDSNWTSITGLLDLSVNDLYTPSAGAASGADMVLYTESENVNTGAAKFSRLLVVSPQRALLGDLALPIKGRFSECVLLPRSGGLALHAARDLDNPAFVTLVGQGVGITVQGVVSDVDYLGFTYNMLGPTSLLKGDVLLTVEDNPSSYQLITFAQPIRVDAPAGLPEPPSTFVWRETLSDGLSQVLVGTSFINSVVSEYIGLVRLDASTLLIAQRPGRVGFYSKGGLGG